VDDTSPEAAAVVRTEDVRGLLRLRADDIDRAYIERWLDELGVRAQWMLALKAQ